MAASRDHLDAIYRAEARRVLATLIRILGSFDAAEDAMHDAFAAAAQQWPHEGVPANPYSWLVSTGRFKTLDRWRRQTRLAAAIPEMAMLVESVTETVMHETIADDELRLIFACCHPALSPDARIALTLREVAGLTTEEIARAYLVSVPTIAQRIVRAKAKIRDDAILYQVPDRADLAPRKSSVLQVIYLIFNEGYAATAGPNLARDELCAEAIRLGRLTIDLLDDAEAIGLLALMLLHQARRVTRTDAVGDLVLLENQDRSRWDRLLIAEAQGLIDRAILCRQVGPYLLQAAIASLHAEAPSIGSTDWAQIVALYDVLDRIDNSPVVTLNRATALSMRDGPAAGLAVIEDLLKRGDLDAYAPAHVARAEMQRRLGLTDAAMQSYRRALALTQQAAERRFLERTLAGRIRS